MVIPWKGTWEEYFWQKVIRYMINWNQASILSHVHLYEVFRRNINDASSIPASVMRTLMIEILVQMKILVPVGKTKLIWLGSYYVRKFARFRNCIFQYIPLYYIDYRIECHFNRHYKIIVGWFQINSYIFKLLKSNVFELNI